MPLFSSISSFSSTSGKRLFRHFDYLAMALEAILLVIGVSFIYGTGVEVGGDMANKWIHQLFWIILGGGIYLTIATVDYHIWCRHGWKFYIIGIFLLLYVLFFGRTLNNSRGWIDIPGTSFLLQPAEIVKPATLLFAGWIATRPALRHSRFGLWLPSFLIIMSLMLPMLLICLQPDTGTAMVMIPLASALVFMAGMKWRYFFLTFFLAVSMVPLLYMHAKPYQQERIKVFLAEPIKKIPPILSPFLTQKKTEQLKEHFDEFINTTRSSSGKINAKLDDWNAVQALLAVGSAGLYGKGYLRGTQHVLGYLPKTVAPTDFIFAVIAEETGFLGASTLIGIFGTLILCFFYTALCSKDPLGCFLCIGVITIFSTHILINVSMTIRAAPIVGLPLPFVSYGGSFMLGTMMLAGIVQSVRIHSKIHDFTTYIAETDEVEEMFY